MANKKKATKKVVKTLDESIVAWFKGAVKQADDDSLPYYVSDMDEDVCHELWAEVQATSITKAQRRAVSFEVHVGDIGDLLDAVADSCLSTFTKASVKAALSK